MSATQMKLIAALAAPVALAIVLAGWLGGKQSLEQQREQTFQALEAGALLAREALAGRDLQRDARDDLDAFADRFGDAAGVRVTLVAADGSVVGDSEVSLPRLAPLENHAMRPEVRAALDGGIGRDERRSNTVWQSSLYVAVALPGGGAVRLASLSPGAAAGIWPSVLRAGGVALVLAVALAFALGRWARRPVAQLQALTDAIAAGDLAHRLPRGQPEAVASIATSIQALAEQLSARLREATHEKEQLRAVLDGMTEAVLVVDRDGAIVLANDRLRDFFGVTGTLTGRTALQGVRDATLAEILLKAHTKPEPVTGVLQVTRPLHRTLRVHAVRFPSAAPEPRGTVAVFHDVTELTRLEQMRRDFVANASHELRTPLAAIRGYAETLLGSNELAESDRRNYLEIIDRHARRLGNLVSDLLELSRIESGHTALSPTPVDVAQLAAAILRENRRRFEERGLEASHDVEGEPTAWADAAAVEQILTNLVDNAIKYSEPGGSVHVEIAGDERMLRVEVRDTGLGIPETDLGRIFERFYRVDKARSRAAGGTGLGLAIVKHLVQAMRGDISVESRVGVGSTFRITLPRPQAPTPPSGAPGSAPQEAATPR